MKSDTAKITVSYPSMQSKCAECGTDLSPSDKAIFRAGKWNCLTCADLDHLVFLTAGNTALTRRATNLSTLSAVVFQYSKSRKHNQRIGTLVEEAALAKAEAECAGDEKVRAFARDRAAARREKLDAAYIRDFAEQIGTIYPGCPADIRNEIAEHACEKHSGRVGRSAAAKEFSRFAISLAVQAHVRHRYTLYDSFLAEGYGRESARQAIEGECGEVLAKWQKPEEYYPTQPMPDWAL